MLEGLVLVARWLRGLLGIKEALLPSLCLFALLLVGVVPVIAPDLESLSTSS
jgi:hypothetical protein